MKEYVDIVFGGDNQKHAILFLADGTKIGHFLFHSYSKQMDDYKLALAIKKLYEGYLKEFFS